MGDNEIHSKEWVEVVGWCAMFAVLSLCHLFITILHFFCMTSECQSYVNVRNSWEIHEWLIAEIFEVGVHTFSPRIGMEWNVSLHFATKFPLNWKGKGRERRGIHPFPFVLGKSFRAKGNYTQRVKNGFENLSVIRMMKQFPLIIIPLRILTLSI